MIRSAFLKRMALAAAACAFIDVPWPKQATLAEGKGSGSIRNVVVVYGSEGALVMTDEGSIARYGRRWVRIDAQGSVGSRQEAEALAAAILADLS